MKRQETRVQQYTVHHPHLTQKYRGAQWRDERHTRTEGHGVRCWRATARQDKHVQEHIYVLRSNSNSRLVVVYNICETGIQGEHQEQRTLPTIPLSPAGPSSFL